MHSYKTDCPQCGGDNLYCTPANGMKYCFNCGYKEIQRGFSRPFEEVEKKGPIDDIRAVYATLTDYYHSNIAGVARRYLHSRGITDSMIETYKLGYCPPNDNLFIYKTKEAQEAGIALHETATLQNRIIFPYFVKGTVVDLRGRSIDPNDDVRYKSPHNRRYYRGADYLYGHDNMKYPHILVEGEIKRIIVESLGYRACGTPGVTIQFSTYMPGKVYICLDSEAVLAKRLDVARSVIKVAVKSVDPFVMELPLNGKSKMGADDLILENKDQFLFAYRNAIPFDVWKRLVTF